jgi:hypothetical protein
MHDDSDDDDVHVKSAGSESLKLEQDPGSNEYVNVIAPQLEEEEEVAVKEPEIEAARTLLPVEEIPNKPVEKLAELIAEKAPPTLDNNDAGPNSPIFTKETPLQLEPESVTGTKPTESLQGVRGDRSDEPQMPGSFDMSTASSQKQVSWAEMLKNLGL